MLHKNVPANKGKLTITDTCSKQCSKEKLTAFKTRYTISFKLDETHMMMITYGMQMHQEFITTLPKQNILTDSCAFQRFS